MAYTWEDLMRMQHDPATATASQPDAPGTISAAPGSTYGSPAGMNTQKMAGGDDQDVDGSKFVNFSRLWNANSEKAGDMASRTAKKTQEAGDALGTDEKTANDTFYSGLKANQGTAYSGETISDGTGSTTNSVAPNGTGLQSQKQGLQAAPGAITPAEAQTRASQTYGGPTGLAGYGALMQRATDVGDNASALTSQAGLQGQMAGQTGAALNSRGNVEDAALAGVAGGKRFKQLSDRFGNAGKNLEADQAGAQKAASDAAGYTSDQAEMYKQALTGYNTAKAKADADKAAADKAGADDAAAHKKAKSLDQYMTPDAGYYLERAGELTSPIDAIMRYGFGKESVMSGLTDSWEKNLGNPIGGHRSAKDELGKYTRDVQEKVYGSMTQAEADALQGMGPAEQQKWIWDRVQRLGLSGTDKRT